MPIETIQHIDKSYPKFQSEGFAAQFCMPFAQKVIRGVGYDIGCNRSEWSLAGSILIDPAIDPAHDAMNLPEMTVDYVFSSHCLEHLPDWVGVLDHWASRIRTGGVLFLYLPHPSQGYWLPWNNRKHYHSFSPEIIEKYLQQRGWKNIFVSGADLNNSFIAMAEKS